MINYKIFTLFLLLFFPISTHALVNTSLNYPSTGHSIGNRTIVFNCTSLVDYEGKFAYDANITNVTLYTNFTGSWVPTSHNRSGPLNNTYTYFQNTTSEEGHFQWNCYGCDNNSNCNFSIDHFTLIVDTPPSIEINFYDENFNISSQYPSFNITATDNLVDDFWCNLTINSVVNRTIAFTNGTSPNITVGNAMADGYYNWSISCNSSSGAWNSTSTRNITIDTKAPIMGINGTNTTSAFNGSHVAVWANFTDNLTNVSNAWLMVDGIVNSTNSTGVSDHLIINFTYIVPISFTGASINLTIVVNDSAGNSNQTDTIYINITDVIEPHVTLNEPIESYNVSSENITFNVTITDNVDRFIWCNLTINDVVNRTFLVTNGTDNITYASGSFADGYYQWNITCNDTAGNVNKSITRNFTIDTKPPVLNFNATNSTSANKSSSVLIQANFTDATTNLTWMWLVVNGTVNSTTFAGVSDSLIKNFSYYIAPELENNHLNFTILVNDSAGNVNQTSTMIIRVNDTTLPFVTINSPIENLNSSSDNITFNFSASDNGAAVLWCNLTINNVVNKTFSVVNGTSPNISASYNLSDGYYQWNITCNDTSANINTTATRNFTIDTIPPVLNKNATNTTTALVGHHIDIWTNFTDTTTNVTWMWLLVNGTLNATTRTGVGDDLAVNFTYIVSAAEARKHLNLSIVVNDTTGNTAQTYTQLVTVSDNSPPDTILNFPSDNWNSSASTVTFNFTVTDNLDSELYCNITINNVANRSFYAASGADTLITVSDFFSNGNSYQWNVSCNDSIGNVNISETWSFNIDAVLPATAPNITHVNDSNNDGNIEINWTADPNAFKYGLYRANYEILNNATGLERIANVTGTYYEDNTSVHGTIHWYVMTTIDYAGNENSSIVNITINRNNATANDSIIPSRVTNLNVTGAGDTAVLRWHRVRNDTEGNNDSIGIMYEIWRGSYVNLSKRCVNDSGTYLELLETVSTNTTTDTVTDGGTYHYVVISVDDANQSNRTIVIEPDGHYGNTSLDVEESTTRLGTPGGGGGGGGGAATKTATSETVNTGLVRAGTTAKAEFTASELLITDIEITVKQTVTASTVTVINTGQDRGVVPSAVDDSNLVVHSYLRIVVGKISDSNIEHAVIKFRVAKAEGYEPGSIHLRRYGGFEKSWEILPTKLLRQDSDYYYYEANAEGFSVFAIVAKKLEMPSNEATTISTGELKEEESCRDGECSEECPGNCEEKEPKIDEEKVIQEKASNIIWIIVSICVVIGLLLALVILFKKD